MEIKYVGNIKKRIGRTIQKQQMIQEGDRIVVALSGGKDSLILLEALADRKRCMPFDFELFALHIHINNIGYKTDVEYLRSICSELTIPFLIKDFHINLEENSKKSKCFICSWNRRKAIFEYTKEMSCNKLAFGHHMDDALETLFMNMLYHGSISSLPYKLKMFEGRVEVIRPLLELTDGELLKYGSLREFRKELKVCPYENTKRKEVKELIESMTDLSKVARKNIFRSMNNMYPDYLPKPLKD